jgi:hypothetical protein
MDEETNEKELTVLRAAFGQGPISPEELQVATADELRVLAGSADVRERYVAAWHPNTSVEVRGVLAHDVDDLVALAAISHGAPVGQWRPNLLLVEKPREFIRFAVSCGDPTTFLELSAWWAGSVSDLSLAVRDATD